MSHDTFDFAHLKTNSKCLCLRGQAERISLSCLAVWMEQTGAHFCIHLRAIVRAIVARLSGRRPTRWSLCRSSGSRGGGGFIWWWRLESIQEKKTLSIRDDHSIRELHKQIVCECKIAVHFIQIFRTDISTNATNHETAVQIGLPTVP